MAVKIITHDRRVGRTIEAQSRESMLSAHIQHPNVVTTYKAGVLGRISLLGSPSVSLVLACSMHVPGGCMPALSAFLTLPAPWHGILPAETEEQQNCMFGSAGLQAGWRRLRTGSWGRTQSRLDDVEC